MSRKVMGRLAAAGCAGALAGGIFVAPAASGAPYDGSLPGLVFLQTNDTAANSVAVYDRHANGSLTAAGTYSTGGRGGLLDAPKTDQLASQGSVTYDAARQLLYVVNAGSNTVTVFAVDGDKLRQVQVISSGGSFPVSVAVRGAVAYVLNARDGGSIQGFLRLDHRLLRIPAWHRALGLDTSMTPQFLGTPGDVAFSPDGAKLAIATKNNNQIDVFNLHGLGTPSAAPVVTPDAGTVPFALTFDAADHLDVAEAAGSVASYVVNRDGTLTLVRRHATNQQATCWVVNTRRYVFATNTVSNTVSGYTAHSNGLSDLGLTATDATPTDEVVSSDGRYLYVRTGGVGKVEEFAISSDGTLTSIGSVAIVGSTAGEGIASS